MNYAETFDAVVRYQGKGIRSILRDKALDLLSMAERVKFQSAVYKKPRVHLLYIHHIFKDEEKGFIKLLKFLSKDHEFISHDSAVDKILTGSIDKPYISFSSDDGFKNNLKAAEILDQFGAKACFYVNPSTIGLKDPDQIKKFCNQKLDFPATEFLEWNDLEKLVKSGHEIGSHTRFHDNLVKLSTQEVEDDLRYSKEILDNRLGETKHFAYPYGRFVNFNGTSQKLAFDVGYKSVSSAERGAHYSDKPLKKEELFLRREHIIAAWPLGHMKYFIAKSAKQMSPNNNFSPYNNLSI